MDDNQEFVGRKSELDALRSHLFPMIENRKPGILHITGPPGTGKTMCLDYILKQTPIQHVSINCYRFKSSKMIIMQLCNDLQIKLKKGCSESEMMLKIAKHFKKNFAIILLDELDQLPKSQNVNFIRTAMTWPIILIGVSNTLDLSSRYDIVTRIAGRENVFRLVFRPYTSKTLKDIITWYTQNDENYSVDDEVIMTKGLDMIAKKFANDNGDIRQALNAFKSLIDDRYRNKSKLKGLGCVVNSIKKRQAPKNQESRLFEEIVLVILAHAPSNNIATNECLDHFNHVASNLGLGSANKNILREMIDRLLVEGLISLKKPTAKRLKEMIQLTTSPDELDVLTSHRETIEPYLKL